MTGILARWRKREATAPTLPEMVEASPELAEVFARLGEAPGEAARVRALLDELKSLIRTELNDFPAFRAAVEDAVAQFDGSGMRLAPANRQLLEAVRAAGSDETAVLTLLNRDPVHEQLPFIEQIPVQKAGEIAWRTPVEHSLIRKQPADPQRFGQALRELESYFRTAHPARAEEPRMAVLAAVARLHRELSREKAYLPTALQFLESKVAEFETRSLEPEARALRDTLLRVLEEVSQVRATCAGAARLEPETRQRLTETVARQASVYLRTPRIQTRWLTSYLMRALLDEQLTVMHGSRRARALAVWVREEVECGCFDAAETGRRLRELEAQGLCVHSIAYALLRLAGGRPAERSVAAQRGV